MSKNNSATTAGGVTGLTLLQIAFIVLKLTKVIDWSWWWVLSPMWGPVAIAILAVLVFWLVVRK